VREGDVAAALAVGVRVVLVGAVLGCGGHECSLCVVVRPRLSLRSVHGDINI
jgi:hypothetical protein